MPKTKVSKAVKKYVKKELDKDIEDKYFVTDIDEFIDVNANFLNLTLIPQGTDQSERIGNNITTKSIYCGLDMLLPQGITGPNYSAYNRMVIFQDTGSIPGITGGSYLPTDILEETNNVLTSPLRFDNFVGTKRFKLIKDMKVSLLGTGAPAAYLDRSEWHTSFTKKHRSKVSYVNQDASGNNVGQIYLMLFGSEINDLQLVNGSILITYEDA